MTVSEDVSPISTALCVPLPCITALNNLVPLSSSQQLLELDLGKSMTALTQLDDDSLARVFAICKSARAEQKERLTWNDVADLPADSALASVLSSLLAQTPVQVGDGARETERPSPRETLPSPCALVCHCSPRHARCGPTTGLSDSF